MTELSLDEAQVLGFEIRLTEDKRYDCALWVHVTAPKSLHALAFRRVGGGLLDGDEPVFTPSTWSKGTEYEVLLSGSALPKLVIIAEYTGGAGGTVYRFRFADKSWECE